MEPVNVQKPPRRNREWTGIFLIIVGALLLVNKVDQTILPDWLFHWPMLLIGIGLLIGIQHNFRHASWLILVLVGSAFLIDQQFHELKLHELLWPGIIVLVGISFLFRRRYSSWDKKEWKDKWKNDWHHDWRQNWQPGNTPGDINVNSGEFIDATNVFGSTKKVVLSKNFRGGDITCFMGGADIDLTQADIQGPVRLDVTMVFGGVKIIVPSNWDVKNEITAVFGGIEDKRTVAATNFDPSKVLILEGTALFAGIEIRNF